MSNVDQPREPFIPENGETREKQNSQVQRGLWKRAPRGRFVYSQERVDKADIRSLDRIWGRLEEHVARNNTAYRDNKNLPTLPGTQSELSSVEGQQSLSDYQSRKRRQTFQRQLGNVAAFFFVIALVGSLLVVLQTARHANTITGGQSDTPVPAASSKTTASGKQFIAITTQQNGAYRFSPTKASVTVGQLVIWQNQTPVVQVILSENGSGIKLTPKEYKAVVFNEVGTCLLHLQSQPTAVVAILVGKNAPPSNTSICAFRPAAVTG